MSRSSAINHYIDHTLLKPDATAQQIKLLCAEAREYQFKSVCIAPIYVPLAVKELENSPVKVCTVVGFPLGYSTIQSKFAETAEAIEQGADEIDMVISITSLKSGDSDTIREEISILYVACKNNQVLLKVIIETCLLTLEEKKQVLAICNEVGVDFVKTSTGFAGGGAAIEDVRLMREHLNENIQIKASGGIKTPTFAQELIEAGATRLGTSSGIKLME